MLKPCWNIKDVEIWKISKQENCGNIKDVKIVRAKRAEILDNKSLIIRTD